MAPRVPSYRLHRPTGQAVVTLAGRDLYLGRHGSAESHAEYRRLTAEWLAAGNAPSRNASDATVSELMVAYVRHAESYYAKNGKPTSELTLIKLSLRALKPLYGHTPAREFGPLALKSVRQSFIGAGLCRREVNRRTGLVVRFFKWCVKNELVPPSVHHGLRAVPGLRKGRTGVRESEPVRPVPDDLVDAVRPHVARQVWAMVEVQRLTGARPGEVVAMRTGNIDRSGPVWVYSPPGHKTEHHDRARAVYLGPQSQAVVAPWLRADPTAPLFQPREADAEKQAAKREARKTPVQPSQKDRRKAKPRKQPGKSYTVASYRRAIAYGCEKAQVEAWHPHRLRHSAATRLRRQFGLDVARVILGHSSPVVTEIYAEVDHEKAKAVMSQVG